MSSTNTDSSSSSDIEAGFIGLKGTRPALTLFLRVLCPAGRPFVAFIDMGPTQPRWTPQTLIGSHTTGYSEGYRDEALFERELYIAVSASPNKFYVADKLNCKLRQARTVLGVF
jgi:hypothetical protein